MKKNAGSKYPSRRTSNHHRNRGKYQVKKQIVKKHSKPPIPKPQNAYNPIKIGITQAPQLSQPPRMQ